MADQRLERMEKELSSLNSMEERLVKRMEEMMAAMWNQFQNQQSKHDHGEGSSRAKGGRHGSGRSENGLVTPKLAKLDFPKFDGSEDPTSWVCRAEQFFDFQGTSEDDKLPLAAYHLEGEAQLWYQLFKESEDEPTWELMKNSLHVRYGPTQFDDFYGDLTKLKQTGTVREYQAQYEGLMSRAGRLSANQQIGGFVSGLKENIRAEVRASRPSTLIEAVGLARLFEARSVAQRKQVTMQEGRRITGPSHFPPMPSSNLSRGRSPMVKRLNPAELKERRDRGLCFNCDEKFSPGHRCKKLFLIEGVYEEEVDTGREEVAENNYEEEEEVPEISIHAISRVQAPQTMKVKGSINEIQITMLVDTGSTHNFLSIELA